MGALYFAAPWFWLGMLSLIIPFLLLLTKAKSMRVTNFSTVLFLRSITEKASNVIQWKRLLLLFIRLLMLFALAAAFTLPFLNRRGGLFLGQVQKHFIFVLDDSYSMGYLEGKKTLFQTAKEKIEKMAKDNKRGKTWYSFYTFNEHLDSIITKTTDRGKLMTEVRDAKLSAEGTSYTQLLSQMKEKISVDPEIPTQVFILSDFSTQETQFRDNFETLLQSWCDSCRTNLVAFQPKSYRNFSIRTIFLPPHFFVPNVEEEIRVGYQAFGMAGQEIEMSLSVAQSEIAKQKVVIPDSGKGVVVFRQKFPAPGIFPLRAQVGPDALESDNARYALIRVHEPLRVLLIENREYPYPFESPYYYFTQVLESGRSGEIRSWIDIAKTPLKDLSEFKMNSYDLAVMADAASLDPKQATQLRYYLKEGGTILFAPGKTFEGQKNLNSNYLIQLLGGIFGELIQAPSLEKPIHLSAVNYNHPLFRVFDNGLRGDLKTVSFFKALPFIPQEKTEYQALLWLDSRQPALLEVKKEKGRIFLWASSLNQEWTDFPKQPLYVPFIFELVKYAALRGVTNLQNLTAGERLVFDEKGVDLAKPIELKNPKGEQSTLYRDKQNTASMKADVPGFYSWMNYTPEGIEKVWAVMNINPEESKPAYREIKTQEASKETKKQGHPGGGLAARFFIYRPFLYVVLVMLLAEAWVANQFYKPRIL